MSDLSTDAGIDLLLRQLVDHSLPKSEWTHAAHFAAALCLIKTRGPMAVKDMPPLIRSYNESTGVANTDTTGYHETITLASLRAAHTWLTDRPNTALHRVLGELLGSFLGRSNWVLDYWSAPVLFSSAARKRWIEPDLRELPFLTLERR